MQAIEDDNVDDVIARAEAKRRGFQYDTDSGPGTPRKRGRSRAIEEELLSVPSKKRGRPKKSEIDVSYGKVYLFTRVTTDISMFCLFPSVAETGKEGS